MLKLNLPKTLLFLTIITLTSLVVISLPRPARAVDSPNEGYGWARTTLAAGASNAIIYKVFDSETGAPLSADGMALSLLNFDGTFNNPSVYWSCTSPCPTSHTFSALPNNFPGGNYYVRGIISKSGYHTSVNPGYLFAYHYDGSQQRTYNVYLTKDTLSYQIKTVYPTDGTWYNYDPTYTINANPAFATAGYPTAATNVSIDHIGVSFGPAAGPFPHTFNLPAFGYLDGFYYYGQYDYVYDNSGSEAGASAGGTVGNIGLGIDTVPPHTSVCTINNSPSPVAPSNVNMTITTTDTSNEDEQAGVAFGQLRYQSSSDGGATWSPKTTASLKFFSGGSTAGRILPGNTVGDNLIISYPPGGGEQGDFTGAVFRVPTGAGIYRFYFAATDKTFNPSGINSQMEAEVDCGTITILPADFSAKMAISPISIDQGSYATAYLTLTDIRGFAGTGKTITLNNLTINGSPFPASGMTASALPSSVTIPPSGTTTIIFTLTTTLATPPSPPLYVISVTANSGGIPNPPRTATATLAVSKLVATPWLTTKGGDIGSKNIINLNPPPITNQIINLTATASGTTAYCGPSGFAKPSPGTFFAGYQAAGNCNSATNNTGWMSFDTRPLINKTIVSAQLTLTVDSHICSGCGSTQALFTTSSSWPFGTKNQESSATMTSPFETTSNGTFHSNLIPLPICGTTSCPFSPPFTQVFTNLNISAFNSSQTNYRIIGLDCGCSLTYDETWYFGATAANSAYRPTLTVVYKEDNANGLVIADGAINNTLVNVKNWLIPSYGGIKTGNLGTYSELKNKFGGSNQVTKWTPICDSQGDLPASCVLGNPNVDDNIAFIPGNIPDSAVAASTINNILYDNVGKPDLTYNIADSNGNDYLVLGSPTVVFLSGNFYINKNIVVTGTKKWTFIVGGNVWVNPTVTRIDATILADKDFESAHWLNGNNQFRATRMGDLEKKIRDYYAVNGFYPQAANTDTSDGCSTSSPPKNTWFSVLGVNGTSTWGGAIGANPVCGNSGLKYELNRSFAGYTSVDISIGNAYKDPTNGVNSFGSKSVTETRKFAFRYFSWKPAGAPGPSSYAIVAVMEDDNGFDRFSTAPDNEYSFCGGDYNNAASTLGSYNQATGLSTSYYCNFYPLTVNGSVFANGTITFSRNLRDDNNSSYVAHPAWASESFNFDPSFFYYFAKTSNGFSQLGNIRNKTSEVSP